MRLKGIFRKVHCRSYMQAMLEDIFLALWYVVLLSLTYALDALDSVLCYLDDCQDWITWSAFVETITEELVLDVAKQGLPYPDNDV